MNVLNGQLEGLLTPAYAGGPRSETTVAPAPAPALPPDPWDAWDSFLETTPHTGFMQTSWWVEFRNGCGFDNFGITLKEEGNIIGGAVVLKFAQNEDSSFYYIQDGPVLPADPAAAEAVFHAILGEIEQRRQAEQSVISHLRIEPRWTSLPEFVRGFREIRPLADPFLEARDTRCIDLRPSEAAILEQMKPKGRYNISVARRHGVSVVEDTSPQGIADFLRIYRRMALRKGLRPKPADYFQPLLSTLSSRQRGALFFAEYQGRRVGTVLLVYFGSRATYFFGGSLAIHRHVMAPYLLHFEIMRKAKALGHESYDLWGIAPPNEPDHPWQDISAFKAKFGGREVHLVPTLDLVYDVGAYERYLATSSTAERRAPALRPQKT